ncbi:Ff.00g117360.m01.CDS01 [Fusarium sp. VM40]|nr:Ff.00g117360.m01.CDS01 [Fusarium sp. VM40]
MEDLPSDERMLKTLNDFRDSNITLVEWETPLLQRLGYPLAPKPDFIFLVPDDQIQDAFDIAKANGLLDSDQPPNYISEHTNMCFRFAFGTPSSRLILLPLSWPGIKMEELIAVENTNLPCSIWTIPIPAFCAAYLRMIMQEGPESIIRIIATADLSGVVGYSLFDMSYEGSYMPAPGDDDYVEDEEKDALELEKAIDTMKKWNFIESTEWARDIMLQLVSGKLLYDSLPSKGGMEVSQGQLTIE